MRLSSQECVQRTVEQGVDVPVLQIQEWIVQVGKERPGERMGIVRGITFIRVDGLVPLIRKEILEEIKDQSPTLHFLSLLDKAHTELDDTRQAELDVSTLWIVAFVGTQFLVEMLVWMMCFWTIWSALKEKKPKGSFILENGLHAGLDSHCWDTVSPRSTAIAGKTGHDRCRHNLDIERPTPTDVAACSSCSSLPRLLGSLWDSTCDADVF